MNILINIDVPDLHAASAFYQAALGLRQSRTLDDDVVELSGASSTIYLLQKPAGSIAISAASSASDSTKDSVVARSYARHWTPVHLDFVVDDLAVATERAIRAGARQESEREEWRGSRCITFSDPFGHGFCLIKFDGETYREA
jgi:predicted enzyme related to lactoylglutathione lyase